MKLLLLTFSIFILVEENYCLCQEEIFRNPNAIKSSEIDIKKAKHHTAIILNTFGIDNFICSGALIRKDVVITAAQCIKRLFTSNWKVRVGSSNYKSGGQLIEAKTIVRHNNYDSKSKENDVALLFLKNPVTINSKTDVIQLPTKQSSMNGLKGRQLTINQAPEIQTQSPTTQPTETQPPETQPPETLPPITQPPVTEPSITQPTVTQPTVTQPTVTQPTVTQPTVTQPTVTQPSVTQPPINQIMNDNMTMATGWGSSKKPFCLSSTLQKLDLNIVKNSECENSHSNLADTVICAKRADDSRTFNFNINLSNSVLPCRGDIGGALVKNQQLIGIHIGGNGCYNTNQLIIFTNITKVMKWIESTLDSNPPM